MTAKMDSVLSITVRAYTTGYVLVDVEHASAKIKSFKKRKHLAP